MNWLTPPARPGGQVHYLRGWRRRRQIHAGQAPAGPPQPHGHRSGAHARAGRHAQGRGGARLHPAGPLRELGAGAEAVLFAAARYDHVSTLIAPSLNSGKWVISDRFHDSTRAYQGLTGGVDDKLIRGLETLAPRGAHASTSPSFSTWTRPSPSPGSTTASWRRRWPRPVTGSRRKISSGTSRLRAGFPRHRRHQSRTAALCCRPISPEDALEEEIWDTVIRRFPELTEQKAS